jgi:hypothetical protein
MSGSAEQAWKRRDDGEFRVVFPREEDRRLIMDVRNWKKLKAKEVLHGRTSK